MTRKAPPVLLEQNLAGQNFKLPQVDENGVPVEKMPNCPECGDDELGMLQPDVAFCYACATTVLRKLPV